MDVNPTDTVTDDLAPSAPVDNGPLNEREADERLTALLGGNPETDLADEEDGNSDASEPVEPTEPEEGEEDIDVSALEEDEGTVEPVEDDASEAYSGGRFASDDAKVTLDDGSVISVAELKRNNLFQRDYTKKTTELTEKSKAVEAKEAEYGQALNDLNAQRDWAMFVLQNYAPQQPTPPTVAYDVDPYAWGKYQAAEREWNQAVQAYQTLNQGSDAERQKSTQAEQAKYQERLQSEVAALHKVYPHLKDEARQKAWFDETFKEAAESYGYTMDELRSIPDHRMIRTIRDAVLYRRAKNKAPEVKKEVQRKPPVAQGSGPRSNPEKAALRESEGLRKNLRETGSTAAADAYLAKLLS